MEAWNKYKVFFWLWFAVWAWTSAVTFSDEKDYFLFALRSDQEALLSAWVTYDEESQDYYQILKACDQLLPSAAELTLVLPDASFTKFMCLREKGRYILYPRNYGDNRFLKEYVLVYGVDNFSVSSGYNVIRRFAPDKYLLGKKGI